MRTVFVVALAAVPLQGVAQTVTVVGTPHFGQLDPTPNEDQVDPVIEALGSFGATQICVETMSGTRIETLMHHPVRNARLLQSHGGDVPHLGLQQQLRWELDPADARTEARELAKHWDEVGVEARVRLIGLQMSAYEFPSAVLNWSYLTPEERKAAIDALGRDAGEVLDTAFDPGNEIYMLAVPLALSQGLHWLCGVDSRLDEQSVMELAQELMPIIERDEVQVRVHELMRAIQQAWLPEKHGEQALLESLSFFNSEAYADMDSHSQWDVLQEFDGHHGAGQRRLLLWHARNAEIAAEIFRALAQGPNERVLVIIGAAHRPFLETLLGSQPWLILESATELLGGE